VFDFLFSFIFFIYSIIPKKKRNLQNGLDTQKNKQQNKKKSNVIKHVHFITQNTDKSTKAFLETYLKKLKFPYWDALENKQDNMFESSKKRSRLFVKRRNTIRNVGVFWKMYTNLFNCSFWRVGIKNWKDWFR